MSDFGMPYLMECGTLEKCAQLAKDLWLDFVELNLSFPACQLEELTKERLTRLQAEYGVYFTIHMDEAADPFAFNTYVRTAWLNTFRRTIALCKDARVPVINMHMPRGIYITLDGERTFMYARYRDVYMARVEAFRDECAQLLAGSGVRICVENTDGFMPHEREAVERLLESDVFGLTLDIGHDHAAEHVDQAFYSAHLSRLCHMHAHDCDGQRPHLALGQGVIDLPRMLGLAVQRNARIVLEIKTVESLRKSVAALYAFAPRTAALARAMYGRPVLVRVDRPLGSSHPRHPNMVYPCNYGFVGGLAAPDGSWQDAYILGVNEPVQRFTGRLIAVITREDDVETKWVVAPEGVNFTAHEIRAQVRFVEQYFKAHVRLVK